MRLLVCTQAVDTTDPGLGFFHAWLGEIARHAEHVTVICLTEGKHALPSNVRVHSLGKEKVACNLNSRYSIKYGYTVLYAIRFLRIAWELRHGYDAVFVHMNEEYVLLGGDLWRLLGKRVVLWRNHKKGRLRTRVAGWIAHVVCYTSRAAYVASFPNAHQMPIGIDTERFFPQGSPKPGSLLVLGRLDPVKNLEVVFDAFRLLSGRHPGISCDVYGDPTDGYETYAKALRASYADLEAEGVLRYHGAIANAETPGIYASHDIYINVTPSGSFDKTIGEAMASGCVVVCVNDAVREVIPPDLMVEGTPESVAHALAAALTLTAEGRAALVARQRAYIEREHSLAKLVRRLMKEFET